MTNTKKTAPKKQISLDDLQQQIDDLKAVIKDRSNMLQDSDSDGLESMTHRITDMIQKPVADMLEMQHAMMQERDLYKSAAGILQALIAKTSMDITVPETQKQLAGTAVTIAFTLVDTVANASMQFINNDDTAEMNQEQIIDAIHNSSISNIPGINQDNDE